MNQVKYLLVVLKEQLCVDCLHLETLADWVELQQALIWVSSWPKVTLVMWLGRGAGAAKRYPRESQPMVPPTLEKTPAILSCLAEFPGFINKFTSHIAQVPLKLLAFFHCVSGWASLCSGPSAIPQLQIATQRMELLWILFLHRFCHFLCAHLMCTPCTINIWVFFERNCYLQRYRFTVSIGRGRFRDF